MQYRRISADCHLDLPWLPPELLTSGASRELRDRMPYVEDGPDGPRWVTKAGGAMGIPGAVGSVGAPFVPGQNYRVDKMAETGLYEAGKRGERRPGDPAQRARAGPAIAPPRRAVHRRRRVPDEPHQHHRRDHRRRRLGALSEPAGRLWRIRHRLDPLRARPHGFRVRGPLPRPDEAEAQRVLAAPMPGNLPVPPHRPET